ncbi:MAG: toprim domain-containing protein [gamma proteobacterium symbiont of Taylorina sp.]|nr:toprim domain-containing protein [gamma proteobacterium symbiont of Taylorina sp.]
MNNITLNNLQEMLSFTSSDVPREDWFPVLDAAKNEFGESARSILENWSKQGINYSQSGFNSTWKSCGTGKFTIGTIIYQAKKNGYKFTGSVLSPEEIAKYEAERQARQVEADKKQAWKKHFNKKNINQLLSQLQQSNDSMARYFNNRGLGLFKTPDSIMHHPSVDYWKDGVLVASTPTICSPITDLNNNIESIHKIHITEDGHKFDPDSKRIMSPINTISGSAVKFDFPTNILHLAEGIETSLAVWLAVQQPVWSCLSSGNLEKVIIPESVEVVKIWADKDRSGAGEKSANILAQRLINKGHEVHILLPKQPIPDNQKSIDWCDIYQIENR